MTCGPGSVRRSLRSVTAVQTGSEILHFVQNDMHEQASVKLEEDRKRTFPNIHAASLLGERTVDTAYRRFPRPLDETMH
jgi:hypothetical protein